MAITASPQKDYAERTENVRTVVAQALNRHGSGVLAFSGGKESMVLLDLLAPFRDQLTVAWVNTGMMFPHMEEFVRRVTRGWQFVELRSDQAERFRRVGVPADIVPIFNTLLGVVANSAQGPRPILTDWVNCCGELRTAPLFDHCKNTEARLVIHGQRDEDGAFFSHQVRIFQNASEVHLLAPLRFWSREDVMGRIRERSIELPEQYPEVEDSLECWNCPAQMTDVARYHWMRRRYPELYAMSSRWVAVTIREVLFELERMRPAIEAAGVALDTPALEGLEQTVFWKHSP